MPAIPLSTRVAGRLRREAFKRCLAARYRVAGGPFFADYGWIKLLYSHDGDWQEVSYHQHQRSWHQEEFAVYRALVAPGSTVVDIGANLGFVTTMLATIVGPSGRVYAFEPSPAIFPKLQATIAMNGLVQVEARNVACGSQAGEGRLSLVPDSGNASLVGPSEASLPVRVQPLDAMEELAAGNVDLIKIDTEGFEPEVLLGARDVIRRARPVLRVEMGGDYVESTQRSLEILQELHYDTSAVSRVNWEHIGNGTDFTFHSS